MKKILFIFPLLIAAGLLFNGCEKDEDNDGNGTSGTNGNNGTVVEGCMDSDAYNYDENATEDDGSCEYACDDEDACNYGEDEDCEYANPGYDCDGNPTGGGECSNIIEDGMEYDLDGMAFWLDYGMNYDTGAYNWDLYMMSDDFYWGDDYYLDGGPGQYCYFELFFDAYGDGTYTLSDNYGDAGTFSTNSWYGTNLALDEYADDDNYFISGELSIVSLGGDDWEVNFDCVNGIGENVTGCFTGYIEYMDYNGARNLKTNNNKVQLKKN